MEPQARNGVNSEQKRQSKSTYTQTPQDARNVAEFYRVQPVLDRRIHVLGLGSVGRFIAHSLRGITNPPPVTLIFHRPEILREWKESPQVLKVITDGIADSRGGFDTELAVPRSYFHGKEIRFRDDQSDHNSQKQEPEEPEEPQHIEGESNEPISTLILCTKTIGVRSALSSVKHRLGPESVILFIQNGKGTVEEVNEHIFRDPEKRPHYMIGINSHGMNTRPGDPFAVNHAGLGTMSLGLLPHERDHGDAPYAPQPRFTNSPTRSRPQVLEPEGTSPFPGTPPVGEAGFTWTPTNRYLLRTLLRTPILCATAFSPPDLLQMQLEKLAVNSVINPLTVMLDARNGAILYNYYMSRTMRLLLSEISLVIRSLPELQYIPNVQQRFDPGRLETLAVGVANKTSDNISSMLADARAGRRTEIDYINGWIVKRGEELGIRCLMNYMLMNMVKAKGMIIQQEVQEDVPFVEEKPNEGRIKVNAGTL